MEASDGCQGQFEAVDVGTIIACMCVSTDTAYSDGSLMAAASATSHAVAVQPAPAQAPELPAEMLSKERKSLVRTVKSQ